EHRGPGERAERRAVAGQVRGGHAGRRAGVPGGGRVAQRPDDVEQAAVLQERQPARAAVVEQRPEGLGPHRDLRVQVPGAVEVDARHRLVHAAHAVDRDLLDQRLGELRLLGDAVGRGRRRVLSCVGVHGSSLSDLGEDTKCIECQKDRGPVMDRRADVLVVGAGGSGAVLAARLSEDPGREVLVAEAGPAPRVPAEFPADLLDARFVPGARLGGAAVRAVPVLLAPGTPYAAPRGRFLGGSTTVNGGYFVRARREDFDRWAAAAGDDRWSYERVLPLLRALETDLDFGDAPEHGDRGPVPVGRADPSGHPAAAAFEAAARELGRPGEPDKNAQGAPGFGPVPSNVRDGRRANTAIAYLLAAAHRPNLTVLGGCAVRSLIIDRGRAAGAVAELDGRPVTLEADEIVLCAGALASPRLLHLSGVGPAAELERGGIRVVHDLPSVGAALSDHPQVIVEWTPRRPMPAPASSWLGGALHLPSTGGHEAGDLEI